MIHPTIISIAFPNLNKINLYIFVWNQEGLIIISISLISIYILLRITLNKLILPNKYKNILLYKRCSAITICKPNTFKNDIIN